MSKTYTPGEDADAIIARQVAKGNFPSAEAVVRAGVRMIEEYEADLARLSAGRIPQIIRCRSNEGRHRLERRRTITPKDLIVTDPAYADLDEIFDFIAADGVDAARRSVSEIVDHLHRIATLWAHRLRLNFLAPT